MNGTAHMALGATVGYLTANSLQTDPTTTLFLVGIGGVSGLMPDMDIDGKLSNRITFSHKFIRTLAQTIGILMIIYSALEGFETEKWIGAGAGIGIIIISSFITQRHMLTLSGLGVLGIGMSLQENWLWLLGLYMILASFTPHRSYTHSIAGIVFFGIIAFQFEAAIGVDGIFTTCLFGYISHLIADMKFLPFNKRGVKLFLPFYSKEF
ncbi:metal-dependent hydrolase [Bacillus sp. mrc49]|uniref:metal-dependent hydrolase n=1 Tax=Bacillus sp. mrc49 TaxID=2054913 RepID=UPI000C270886|nr:metal-dependent hydrolase [Bacillus sp. mrc49]PJN91808.1 metal-dependent hydrolase [Bacillus sp. mrc49]